MYNKRHNRQRRDYTICDRRGRNRRRDDRDEWKKLVFFLLENKGAPTSVYYSKERRNWLMEILEEKFGKWIYGETSSGQHYTAFDDMNHILVIGEDGDGHFFMHRKYKEGDLK